MMTRATFSVKLLFLLSKIPKVRGLLTALFRDKVLLKLCDNYNIIDIHFFSPYYHRLIFELKDRKKKVKITIWGSDFYRVDSERREMQRKIYQIVDLIQIETPQIANDFIGVYPELEDKIRIAHFGITQFEVIDELKSLINDNSSLRKSIDIPENKIVITCGTNASPGQQHMQILESIKNLNAKHKKSIFLILPLTYGRASEKYVNNILKKVETLDVPYLIFNTFLSKRDTGILRVVSDVLISIQVTDALSSAIQEYMYSGNIIITGDWLPYNLLKDNGVFYITTSIEDLTETIKSTIDNIKTFKISCIDNKEILLRLSSWNEVIKKWESIYNNMMIS